MGEFRMTIATEVSKVQFDGNGSDVVFPYSFHINSKADLIVIISDANDSQDTLVVDVDYSVSGIGEDAGGNVTTIGNYAVGETPGATPSGSTITIYRSIELLQTTSFKSLGSFLPTTHEEALDNIIKICQQQQEELDRCMKSTVTGGLGDTPGAEYEDDEFRILDNGDNSKKVGFQVSGITAETTRILTVQDDSYTIADQADVDLNTTHRGSAGTDHSDVVANTAVRHNTNLVDSVEYDMTGLADGEFMRYDLGTTKFVPVTIPSGGYWLVANPRFGVPESNLGDVDFRQGRDTARLYAERIGLAGASDTASELYIAVQLPSNFAGWYSGLNISVDVLTNDHTNNSCTLTVYDNTLTADGGVSAADITPSASAAWQTKTDQITGVDTTYAAGDFIVVKLAVSIEEESDYIRFSNLYVRFAPTAIA